MKICSTNVIPPSIPSSRKRLLKTDGNQVFSEQNKTYSEIANADYNQGKISFLA